VKKRVLLPFLIALGVLSLSVPADAKKPPNADALSMSPKKEARELSPQEKALVKPGRLVQFEERFGVPTFVWTAPSSPEEKRARKARARDVVGEARRHLSKYASLYELEASDISAAKVSSVHDTGRGGVIVKFHEEIGGVEVFREESAVMMDRDLERIAVSGYLSGAARKAGPAAFRLNGRDAVAVALKDRTGADIGAADLVTTGRKQAQYEFVDNGPRLQASQNHLVEPARFKPVYFHLPERFEPSYYVEMTVEATDEEGAVDGDLYAYVISARDGEILYRANLTVSDSFTYRLWAESSGSSTDFPSDSPHGDTTPHPTGNLGSPAPPYVASSLHILQAYPFLHSTTDPWLPATATETAGNNVDAYIDRFGPNGYSPADGDFRAPLSATGAFDWTFDPNVDPLANVTQQRAAITSLFYVDNFLHDWFYDSGFDEAAGNAQVDNYGRGGIAGDDIRAEAQDGGGTNNANMSTGADGNRPRQQMFLWSGPQNETITVNSQPSGGTLPPSFNPFQIGTAAFGPQAFDVTADVVRTIPFDGCSAPISNATALAGKIAFIDRGGAGGNCAQGFAGKTANAAAAGAVGVIIANVATSGNPTIAPGMGTTNPPCPAQPGNPLGGCTIGALSLNFADGESFRNTLALGTVNARLKRDPVVSRDGSFDANVIAHEWAHYLSNRNISNGSGLGNPQGGGMGEGWSDFVSLLTTVREGDDLVSSNANWNGVYPLVPYAAVSFTTDPAYFGIRRVPYSTNLSKDPLTFKHIQNGNPLPCATVPIAFGCDGSNNAEVHNTGEVWTSMLWEGFVSLLNAHPFENARLRMRDYLVASLKMTPANPTLVEARDAVLAAAFAADPADHALFCAAFAKRGIGQRAVAPDRFSNTNSGVVESFTCESNLSFVGATLASPSAACDTDTYLDNFETATLSITLRNDGLGPLSATTGTVSTSNPNVTFANGGQLTFPATMPEQTTTATIDVSMAGASGIQDFLIDVSFEDPGITAFPQPVTVPVDLRGQADDVPNASASDDVEPILTAWSVTGSGFWARNRFDRTPPFNHDWIGRDVGGVADSQLVSPSLVVASTGNVSFTFKHRYSFEATFDGGVVEISTNGGSTWTDVGALAFTSGGTYATAPLVAGSALAGRRAFTGNSAGYPAFVNNMTCNLGSFTAGQTIQIRFRTASDPGVGGPGWEIDDLAFSNTSNTPFSVITAEIVATTTSLAAASSQYSDQVTLSATVTSCNHTPTGTVQFQIDRGFGFVDLGSVEQLSGGTATKTFTVDVKAGTYSIKAVYSPDNGYEAGSSGTNSLTVTREDASITPSAANPSTVQVATAGGTASFTLAASVAEVQNGTGQVGGTTDVLGDICNAGLASAPTITLVPVGPGSTIALPATVSCSGGVFTFSSTFTGVPVNVYEVDFELHSDWYVASAVRSVVSVYDPSLGGTNGGGSIVHNGYPASFGFNVRYTRNGAQGSFLYVEHRPTGDYTVKSNVMKSLSIVGNQAIILTKNAVVNGIGNYSVRAVVVDNGSGPTDQYGMTLYGPSNAVVSDEDFSSAPATLTSGNIVVSH
jgi:large repetitive protein